MASESRADEGLDPQPLLRVGGQEIGSGRPCYVIAELGNNHQGSSRMMVEMIKAAARASVDAVKLQRRTLDRVMTRELEGRAYPGENSFGPTYGQHRRAVELPDRGWVLGREVSRDLGLHLIGTPFDPPALEHVMAIGVDAIKIASGDLDNYELLHALRGVALPQIISTGGATIDDIQWSVDQLDPANQPALLHCVSAYPTSPDIANVRSVQTLRTHFPEHVIGYSSHDEGIVASLGAVALGASMVERHFTLYRMMRGTDQVMSSDPTEMNRLVSDIRLLERSLGDGIKRPHDDEAVALWKMRKCLVLREPVDAGAVIQRTHLEARAPRQGISTREICDVERRRVRRSLPEGHVLQYGDLE